MASSSVICITLVLLHLKFINGVTDTLCVEGEREALLKIKQHIIDDYGHLSTWRPEKDCCKWRGILCSIRTRRVVKLDLRVTEFGDGYKPLRGQITDSVLQLKHLNYLDFSCNDFRGNIFPNFSGSLSKLRYLNVSNAGFTGILSNQLRNLSRLQYLDLSFNRFSNIENLESAAPNFFGNLCSLRTLDLSGNKLTGELSAFFERMLGCARDTLEILILNLNQLHGSVPDLTRFPALKELSVYSNKLNGSFPKRFSRTSGLIALDVGGNQLTGSLPDLSGFPSLQKLCTVYNRLNGTIPESIGGLSRLELLFVSHNFLQGVVTETHFRNLSRLRQIYLNDNNLVFRFNSNWIPPFQLDIIGLKSCDLGPHFPKWLQFQNKYYVLDISNASISDSLPHWFWKSSTNLVFLNISHNFLTGAMPDLSSKFDGRPGIDLSSSLFEGPIPLLPSNSSSINLSKNKFFGPISSICSTMSNSLMFLDLSDNMLSGDVPDDCFVNAKQLIVLNLADNNLSGKIPQSVGSLSVLETFTIRNNSFVGEIPLSLKDCRRLKFFDVGYNRLSGIIPEWIGESYKSLVFLGLQNNTFYGNIPVQICYLQNILLLDLSQNNISGTIPRCFNNFTMLIEKQWGYSNVYVYNFSSSSREGISFEGRYSDSTLIGWKGSRYDYRKIPPILKIINLAENKLSGRIPGELTSLVTLVGLNLAKNELTGMIPGDIGDLTGLDWLDLSSNHLSGTIPDSMAEINRLSVFNLSYNNLSGKIPKSTQLQSFDASAYSGNPELCGLPVQKKCPGDIPEVGATNDRSEEEEEDNDEFKKWLYTGLGCGFSVGLWGVLGIVLFVPSWRHAYFQLLDQKMKFFSWT